MAPAAAASSSSPLSSSSRSPASLNPSSPLSSSSYHFSRFTPIQECETEDQQHHYNDSTRSTPHKHHRTPLHQKTPASGGRRSKNSGRENFQADEDGSVSCIDCRPHARERISVIPMEYNNGGISNKHSFSSSFPSPNVIFKSILSSLTKKSPKSSSSSPAAAGDYGVSSAREEQWKIAVAELSHKLIQTTRKRDEAILEASRLKHSMAELEKKLNKLEIYCHNLSSGLEECSTTLNNNNHSNDNNNNSKIIVDRFLVSVAESRSSIRLLARSLTSQLSQSQYNAGKVFDKMSTPPLQPCDVKLSSTKNPKAVLIHLEALLNRIFFEDFETLGFQKSSPAQILNPVDRCESNYATFEALKELTWEEVLSKGTRHFSEQFSSFCDRKMNDIVAMLNWNRAWPEPLLQAFFGASKAVWLVHLLANSVHPGLSVFRVDQGMGFDSIYMEDMGGDRARKLVPTTVRVMVAPGFYVYGNVIKCKVVCRYLGSGSSISSNQSIA
ncbi:IRK-interacting protein [Linum grandiflorum]